MDVLCSPDVMVRQHYGTSRCCRGGASIPSDFGEHLDCDSKAVDSHGADQSQDREDFRPRRRLGKARDSQCRWEERQTLDESEIVVRLWVASDCRYRSSRRASASPARSGRRRLSAGRVSRFRQGLRTFPCPARSRSAPRIRASRREIPSLPLGANGFLARISHHKDCMGPPIRSICNRVKQLHLPRRRTPWGKRSLPGGRKNWGLYT